MEELREEVLLEYISAAGGRVKNSDLLKDFKHFINHSDKKLRAKHRDDFKQIIDKIALVKTDNGEKFLSLKKKYKQQQQQQLLPEREREPGSDGERASVPRQGGMVMWEGGEVSTGLSAQVQPSLEPSTPTEATQDLKTNRAVCSWAGGPAITVTVCSDPPTQDLNPSVVWEEPSPQEGPHEQGQPESPRQAARGWASAPQTEDLPAQNPKEDEPDAVSKSESEQDEDGTGSVGSSAIALDPLEKEWIHSAACGRLPVLNHLLQQDPTLVYKKVAQIKTVVMTVNVRGRRTVSSTALHWAAKHGKEDMATMLVDAGLDVNTRAGYTPLHIAALHDHRHIIDLLINYGANQNVRDYSGHLALQYLKMQHSSDGRSNPQFPVCHGNERRNRKLATLFSGSSKKRWGSAEDLASGEEKGGGSQLLMPPAFRPRKFSR
ncbi:ankyrin repeat domain-containing protein SOWAHC-like isoform X2 [Acipenser oxyrinchus oxyrinchus]|uniref:Ankyrin repeat domain-containing protein SOWAHC-like isoform X2 n=1 Tax=Acipenser oxyrinchus oxyrinchus TaxID=40147 RepID=A0AAD8CWA8_ACIOX|nr:ankyrin repeat domain-containing protein SOWAHC-like isoform X2 [Acipenser oxyrinchus oxyrinchus]